MADISSQQLAELLVQACNVGDLRVLQTLLMQHPGIDVNFATEGAVTLLMHAIIGAGTGANPEGYYLETCQVLLQSGAQLDAVDAVNGRTVAHWAAYYHREDILTELIIGGSDMTAGDYIGNSPFHVAIEEEAVGCIAETLRFLPKEIMEYTDAENRTALVHTVQRGNADICQLLIQAGADLTAVSPESGRTPLHIAAELNNGLIMELLLQAGASIDVPDLNGLAPVHVASIMEGTDALNMLANMGGIDMLNLTDANGTTPLMHSCAYGNENNVKILMKKKVDVRVQDVEGRTCLHWAAMSEYPSAPKCVQAILKKHQELLEAQDGLGRTPLHSCACSGRVESLEVLLSQGADVTAVDAEQHTAVHCATVSGNPPVLRHLIESGCPIATPDIYGAYPLHYASQQAREPQPSEENFEEVAIQSQNVLECLRILLEKGAPVAGRDKQGLQPLHWALQSPGTQTVCALLFSHGAEPLSKNNEGLTCLHVAARQGLSESCHTLLEYAGGSIVNELDQQGQTALFQAVESGSLECVQYLLGVGFSPNHLNNEQRSPSHVAATLGLLHCLELLHAYGANITATSVHGATPLHEAAANGHDNVLKYLLTNGSPTDEPVASSRATPLHYAVSGGHQTCVVLLIENGSDINTIAVTETGEQLTPLDYASDQDEELVEYLRAQGGLTGTEKMPQPTPPPEPPTTEPSLSEEEEVVLVPVEVDDGRVKPDVDEEEAARPDELYVRGRRASSPSKQSLDDVFFEPELLKTADERATTPRRLSRQDARINLDIPTNLFPSAGEGERGQATRQLGLLQRAMTALKKKKPPPPESILSSTVGFYAAHATMLAAAIIGTPLGEKATEVSHRVATDTAEELKKAAAAFEGDIPDLVWLKEEEREPTPPPAVIEEPPTPSPPPPPVPEIKEDPYERRLRKAKAQMDMSKSAAFRAVEELLRAQDTHMKFKRQFEESRHAEDVSEMKKEFQNEEWKDINVSEGIMRNFDERIRKAEVISERVNKTIDSKLKEAKEENDKIAQIMGSMGVSPRPTVSMWLEQKREQKKEAMQEALIDWDRNKERREAAILLEQAITSQRAMQHAAWGAKKDISAKLKVLKDETVSPRSIHPTGRRKASPGKTHGASGRKRHQQNFSRPPSYRSTPKPPIIKLRPHQARKTSERKNFVSTPDSSRSSIRATPHGFRMVHEEANLSSESKADANTSGLHKAAEVMWKMGESYAEGHFSPHKFQPPSQEYLRATGPRDVHAPQTLFFLAPREYHSLRKLQLGQESTQASKGAGIMRDHSSPRKSSVKIRSLEFSSNKGPCKIFHSGSSAQYHSHADSFSSHPRKSSLKIKGNGSQRKTSPIVPMTVIDDPTAPPPIAS